MTKEEIRERLGLMTPDDFFLKKVTPAREHLRNTLTQAQYDEIISDKVGTGKTTEMLLSALEFLTTDANDGQDVVIVAHRWRYANRLVGDLRQMLLRLGRWDARKRVIAKSAEADPPHFRDPKQVRFYDHCAFSYPYRRCRIETPTTTEAP